ncbi:MAG: hypothetical protein K9L59_19780, partial [Desulfobacterales bacterium]|nr:hypothetical protein [Desulfobacterales bacterium]
EFERAPAGSRSAGRSGAQGAFSFLSRRSFLAKADGYFSLGEQRKVTKKCKNIKILYENSFILDQTGRPGAASGGAYVKLHHSQFVIPAVATCPA